MINNRSPKSHSSASSTNQLKFESLEERQLLAADVSFEPISTHGVGRQPFGIVMDDLDNDGDVDLVTANHCSNEPGKCEPTNGAISFSVSVLLNQGDGTFSSEVRYDAGKLPRGVTVADLDGDGIKDLAVTASGIGAVSVLKGNGDGSFQERVDFAAGSRPRSIAAGDLNGDGTTDLVATNMVSNNRASGSVSFLFNNDGQSFSAPQSVSTDRETMTVTVGDLDNDGDLDVVTGNATSSVSVLINHGDGTFDEAVRYSTRTRMTQAIAITDVNADGHSDIVASGSQVAVLLGVGDGTFQNASQYGTRNASDLFAYVSMDTGDIDGDGDTDIAAIDFNRGRMIVLSNDGNGGFDKESQMNVGKWHWGMGLADFDIDGDLDVAAANNGSSNISVLSNTTEHEPQRVVGDSNGDGVFDSGDLIFVFQAAEYEDFTDGNSTFEEGDWNGDGDFDSGDFVFAFQAGTYQRQAIPVAKVVDRIFRIDRDTLEIARLAPIPMAGNISIDQFWF